MSDIDIQVNAILYSSFAVQETYQSTNHWPTRMVTLRSLHMQVL